MSRCPSESTRTRTSRNDTGGFSDCTYKTPFVMSHSRQIPPCIVYHHPIGVSGRGRTSSTTSKARICQDGPFFLPNQRWSCGYLYILILYNHYFQGGPGRRQLRLALQQCYSHRGFRRIKLQELKNVRPKKFPVALLVIPSGPRGGTDPDGNSPRRRPWAETNCMATQAKNN